MLLSCFCPINSNGHSNTKEENIRGKDSPDTINFTRRSTPVIMFIKEDFDFSERTKRNATSEGMELGYRFEETIFGRVVTLYNKADSILNLEKWNNKPPIITAYEQEKQNNNYKVLNVYLSGICPKEIKQRFCF